MWLAVCLALCGSSSKYLLRKQGWILYHTKYKGRQRKSLMVRQSFSPCFLLRALVPTDDSVVRWSYPVRQHDPPCNLQAAHRPLPYNPTESDRSHERSTQVE